MFNKIKTDIIVSRLLEDFNTLKSQNQNDPTVIYMSLLFTLKPHGPFKDFTGKDATCVVKELEKFNDLKTGFNFLCLLVAKAIELNITDKEMTKKLTKEAVDEYFLHRKN